MSHINLLPWRAALKKRRQRRRIFGVACFCLVALAVNYEWRVYLMRALYLEQQRDDFLHVAINQLTQKITTIGSLKVEKKDVVEQAQLLLQLEKQRNTVVRLFNWLPLITPTGVELTSVRFMDTHLDIVGVTKEDQLVAKMTKQIENMTQVASVTLPSITEEKTASYSGYRFTLNITLKPAA